MNMQVKTLHHGPLGSRSPLLKPSLPRQQRHSAVRHLQLPALPFPVPKAAAGPPAGSASPGSGGDPNSLVDTIASVGKDHDQAKHESASQGEPEQKSLIQRLKNWIKDGKMLREKILSLGMGGFASYGVISNLNYGTALTISWLGFVKATGTSPLWPGQWKPFLGFYAGMWAVQNFARPLRAFLAMALAPAFEKVIGKLSEKTGNRGLAFGLLMLVIAAATLTTLFGTLTLLGGFPPAPSA